MADDGSSWSGRPVRLAVTWGLVLTLAAMAFVGSAPAFLVGPGPVISITDGLSVDGVDAEREIDGDFLFTTIAAESVRAYRGVSAALDPDVRLVSRAALVPGDLTDEEFLDIQQDKFEESVEVAAAASQLDGGEPPEAEFDGGVVGGPSAGLLIALAIHDAADPADIAAGRRISGTGEVAADGTVTSVGSIAFKVRGAAEAGAQVFLVPSAQVEEARAAVPDGSDLEVLAVDSVAEAVLALQSS